MGGDSRLSARFGADTEDFKNGIAAVNREMRVVESGFRSTAAALGDWSKDATGLESRIKSLNTQIELQSEKVGALQVKLERVTQKNGANSVAAQQAQIQLNKETETLNKMQYELGGTTNKLNDMAAGNNKAAESGKKFHLSLTDLKSGIELVQMGMEKAKQVYDATIGKTMELAMTVKSLSRNLQISAEDTSRLIQVSDDYGITSDQLSGALEMAVKRGFQPTIENLAALSDEVMAIQDPTERAAVLSEKFGKNWDVLTPILYQGGDAIRSQAAAISDKLILDQAAVDQAEANRVAQKELEDQTEALSLAIGSKLIPYQTALIKTIVLLVSWNEQLNALIAKQSGEVAETADSYDEYATKMVEVLYNAKKLSKAERDLALQQVWSGKSLDEVMLRRRGGVKSLAEVYQLLSLTSFQLQGDFDREAQKVANLTTKTQEQTAATQALGTATSNNLNIVNEAAVKNRGLKESLDTVVPAIDEVTKSMGEAKDATIGMYSALNTGLDSTISSWLEKLEFFKAGGGTIQEQFELVAQALDQNKITPEQAEAYFKELYIASQNVKVNTGEIDTYTAAKNIRDNLGVSMTEAWEIVKNFKTDVTGLSEADLVKVKNALAYGIYDPINAAYNKWKELKEDLAEGATGVVTIIESGSGSGGGGGGGGGGGSSGGGGGTGGIPKLPQQTLTGENDSQGQIIVKNVNGGGNPAGTTNVSTSSTYQKVEVTVIIQGGTAMERVEAQAGVKAALRAVGITG